MHKIAVCRSYENDNVKIKDEICGIGCCELKSFTIFANRFLK